MPETPRRDDGLSRHLVALFTERLPLKASALFFALVLWLVASATQPSEQLVPVDTEFTFDSTLELVSRPPQVQALVLGSARDLIKLIGRPPVIRRTFDADSPDTLRITLTPEDVQLPLGLEGELRIRDVQPRTVVLRFRTQIQRRVPVRSQLRFRGDSGWVVSGAPSIVPESVTVTGTRRVVSKIESVPTVASDVVVRDGMNLEIPLDTSEVGASVRPSVVRVSVPVEPDTTTAAPPAP